MVSGVALTWNSKIQTCVVHSTGKAKYVGTLKAATQLLKDLHSEQDEATEIRSNIRTTSQ